MKGDIKSNNYTVTYFSLNEKNKTLTKDFNRCCRLMDSSTEEVGLILPVFLRPLPDMLVCYTAVLSLVTQCSSSGEERCVTTLKNGCVADYGYVRFEVKKLKFLLTSQMCCHMPYPWDLLDNRTGDKFQS